MRITLIGIFVLALCGVTGSAKAGMMTAGELAEHCKWSTAYDNTEGSKQDAIATEHGFEIGICIGFVAGWQEGTEGAVIKIDNVFHLMNFESGTKVGQLVRVFIVYIKQHPEFENKLADFALGGAAVDAKLLALKPVGPAVNAASAN